MWITWTILLTTDRGVYHNHKIRQVHDSNTQRYWSSMVGLHHMWFRPTLWGFKLVNVPVGVPWSILMHLFSILTLDITWDIVTQHREIGLQCSNKHSVVIDFSKILSWIIQTGILFLPCKGVMHNFLTYSSCQAKLYLMRNSAIKINIRNKR